MVSFGLLFLFPLVLFDCRVQEFVSVEVYLMAHKKEPNLDGHFSLSGFATQRSLSGSFLGFLSQPSGLAADWILLSFHHSRSECMVVVGKHLKHFCLLWFSGNSHLTAKM